MSTRWTEKEDHFIVAHFDAIGDIIGPHDLGRPKGAVAKRAARLKETGAWAVLELEQRCGFAYRLALGLPVFADIDGTNIERATDLIEIARTQSSARPSQAGAQT
jgi:hypothetical protein